MNSTREEPRHDHERKDVDVISMFMIAGFLFVTGVVIFLVVSGMMRYFKFNEPSKIAGPANLPATSAADFPTPRLEVRPGASLSELHAAEEADLNSYGWVDRKSGIVRVPIDRAMQSLLQRGLPDIGAGQTPLSLMQARPSESASPPRLMQKP